MAEPTLHEALAEFDIRAEPGSQGHYLSWRGNPIGSAYAHAGWNLVEMLKALTTSRSDNPNG